MRAPKKKKPVFKKQVLIAVVIGVCTLLIVFALTALSVTPVKYDIAAGEVAPLTLSATRDVVDKLTTEEKRDAARASISPRYRTDDTVMQETLLSVSDYYSRVTRAANKLRDVYITLRIVASDYTATRDELLTTYDPSRINWSEILTADYYNDVRTDVMDMSMPDEAVLALASLSVDQIAQMDVELNRIVGSALDNGIMEDSIAAEKNRIERELALLYPDENVFYLAYYPVEKWLRPNQLYDEQATEQARQVEVDKVQEIRYIQNQTVIEMGKIITEAEYAVLEELGLVGSEDADFKLYLSLFLLLALLFGIFGVYLFQFEAEVLSETRKLLVLACIVVVVAAIAVPLARLDTRIMPAFFGTMLACVLVSQRCALVFNILLAFIASIIASGQTSLLGNTMLTSLMTTIIGGSVSVFALHRPGHRSSLITAGLLGGGASMAAVLFAGLAGSVDVVWEHMIVDCGLALGSGLLGGVLAIGTLPIWEVVFRISTPAKLLELSNPNHQLLKRLTIEAPGTYHHSILTANLAEAGADAVDASPLLCRVAAYFHDVGKLWRPRHFTENQKGDNPHDALDPRESAKIIKSHMEKGLELAQRYKLPREVQKIMMQHHGNSLIPFFYHKAQQAGMEPNEEEFRYKGSRPSTKESAVVMLADCVEAAVRSMGDPDRDQVKDMIDKLIRDKYNDGQLDDCPLSRRDLNKLAQAFLHVFDGALHERVKYPGQE